MTRDDVARVAGAAHARKIAEMERIAAGAAPPAPGLYAPGEVADLTSAVGAEAARVGAQRAQRLGRPPDPAAWEGLTEAERAAAAARIDAPVDHVRSLLVHNGVAGAAGASDEQLDGLYDEWLAQTGG